MRAALLFVSLGILAGCIDVPEPSADVLYSGTPFHAEGTHEESFRVPSGVEMVRMDAFLTKASSAYEARVFLVSPSGGGASCAFEGEHSFLGGDNGACRGGAGASSASDAWKVRYEVVGGGVGFDVTITADP